MKNILLISLFWLSPAFGGEYFCSFKVLEGIKNFKVGDLKNNYKSFSFNTEKQNGVAYQLKKYQVKLLDKKKYILGVLITPNQDVIRSLYSKKGEMLQLRLDKKAELVCNNQGPSAATQLKSGKLKKTSRLEDFYRSILFKVARTVKYKYFQVNQTGKIRSLYFTGGQVFNQDDWDKMKSRISKWCILNTHLKLDEDTYIKKGESLTPYNFNKGDNGHNRFTYSFSFVDFSDGEKIQETSRYIPYSLECVIPKNVPFTLGEFRKLTGSFLKVHVRK